MVKVTAEEAEHLMQEASEKVNVGDRIEFHHHAEPFRKDDMGDSADFDPPKYVWEPVKVVAILPRTPDSAVVVEVFAPGRQEDRRWFVPGDRVRARDHQVKSKRSRS